MNQELETGAIVVFARASDRYPSTGRTEVSSNAFLVGQDLVLVVRAAAGDE